MLLELSDRDRILFHKLHVSSFDISYARQCAVHVKKKDWFREPWSRGTLYFQQTAFVTALVVSYARPFAVGRAGLNFPNKLIPYDDVQMKFHLDLLSRRNRVYAHSDPETWSVRPWKSGDFETTIEGRPWLIVRRDEIDRFIPMTDALIASIADRMAEIRARY